MILLIDNYDSFTYNLYQRIGALTNQTIQIVKNNQIDIKDLNQKNLNGIILSPGPGRPENAGNMNKILKAAIGYYPILGICLGHQAIGEIYGGKITSAPILMHGKTDSITQDNKSLIFKHCPKQFSVARYHSLTIDPHNISKHINISAISNYDHTIQAISDNYNLVFGLEFHPESIMTDPKVANHIFNNFLNLVYMNTKTHINN